MLTYDYSDDIELKRIVIQDYSIEVPSHFQLKEGQGTDSFVGTVTGNGIEILYDFGAYSNRFEDFIESEFNVSNDKIVFLERRIVAAVDPTENFTAMNIKNLEIDEDDWELSLSLYTENITEEEQNMILHIYKSATLIE